MKETSLPSFSSYGDYSSSNYGAHCLCFRMPTLGNKKGITLYYSYDTIVAFAQEGKTTVCKNEWKTTTGRHLNWIDGGNKSARLERKDFEKALKKALREA